jgi:hypothetical protein
MKVEKVTQLVLKLKLTIFHGIFPLKNSIGIIKKIVITISFTK